MVRMVIQHKVRNYGKWRRAYDAFDRERRGMGVKRHQVFRSVTNGNEVTVTHDFASISAGKRFAASQRLREVMKGAGVRGKPAIRYVRPA